MTKGLAMQQLSAIVSLHSKLEGERTEPWLIGGWAVDFRAGRITRDHHDIDLAVWLQDMAQTHEILARGGWRHSPKDGEDGGTSYEQGVVRLELTYLARGEDGVVYTPLRSGLVVWPEDALCHDVRELGVARCRLVSLASLRRSKSSPRPDQMTPQRIEPISKCCSKRTKAKEKRILASATEEVSQEFIRVRI